MTVKWEPGSQANDREGVAISELKWEPGSQANDREGVAISELKWEPGSQACHGNFGPGNFGLLEILVRQTKIFTGKYGPPLQKLVRFEDARFTPSFLNRTQHDSSSTKGSLGNSQRTWRSPKLLQWQADRVSHAIVLIKARTPLIFA